MVDLLCESCGSVFDCQIGNYEKGEKCWCHDFCLAGNVSKALADSFCRCLCARCLDELMKKRQQ